MARKTRSLSRGGRGEPGPDTAMLQRQLLKLQDELSESRKAMGQLRGEFEEMCRRAGEADRARSTMAQLSRELEQKTEKMARELDVARQFQRLFLPSALPKCEGVAFAAEYKPSARLGGDFYDVFDMGNSCVGFLVADIPGNGLAATLISAVGKMAFDTFRQNEYSPKIIMQNVNAQVFRNTLESQFFTAFLGVLDRDTLRLKYVNASHPCPMLLRDEQSETLDTEGMCVGMFEEAGYQEKEVTLRPGDRLLLFTHGLFEMVNAANTTYDAPRLLKLLQTTRSEAMVAVIERLTADVAAHLGGAEQTEDVTLLGLEVLLREARLDIIVIPSEPMQINRVESVILAKLEALNYGERALFGARLAIEEAVINAIKHGNRMDKAKKVKITYSADAKECVIAVEDEGEGFDPKAVPDPTAEENLELPHGRGLVLIRAYMDEVTYSKNGTCVTMRKKAPWVT